jgi:hypothetical protein
VYLNNGQGTFSIAGTWGVPEWSTRNAAVADLNGDKTNRPGPSFVCLNEGGGRFARARQNLRHLGRVCGNSVQT